MLGRRKTISFYEPAGEYGFLANFSSHSIRLDGKTWSTVEHYYQAQKFRHSLAVYRMIQMAKEPAEAKVIASVSKHLVPREWGRLKELVMERAVRAKFEQHPGLKAKLLATGNARILERTVDDAYWGSGPDGNGRNRMGAILMRVRNYLSASQGQPASLENSGRGGTRVHESRPAI